MTREAPVAILFPFESGHGGAYRMIGGIRVIVEFRIDRIERDGAFGYIDVHGCHLLSNSPRVTSAAKTSPAKEANS
jgi:hypothetical protein